MIHIKNSGSSSYLSHLFNQATNCCEALKDINFRNCFHKKLKEKEIEDFIGNNFNSNDFTIVLGIINTKINEIPHIPFFSKVSIRFASQEIQNMGYKFELKNIKKTKN